jgi:hypothetical protein
MEAFQLKNVILIEVKILTPDVKRYAIISCLDFPGTGRSMLLVVLGKNLLVEVFRQGFLLLTSPMCLWVTMQKKLFHFLYMISQ